MSEKWWYSNTVHVDVLADSSVSLSEPQKMPDDMITYSLILASWTCDSQHIMFARFNIFHFSWSSFFSILSPYFYLQHSGGSVLFCLSVCLCKSNQPIKSKLGCYDWAYQSEKLI